MPTTGISNQSGAFLAPTVYTRASWSDHWVAQAYLYCDRIEFNAAPDHGKAVLRWQYGLGQQAGQSSAVVVAPVSQSQIGTWVKIVPAAGINGTPGAWYGSIVQIVDEQGGVLPPASEDGPSIPTGTQQLTCYDLSYQLDLVSITGAAVEQSNLTNAQLIQRAPGFNCGKGWANDDGGVLAPNRSAGRRSGPDGQNTFVFCYDLNSSPTTWQIAQIVEYLLAYWVPLDSSGDPALPWSTANLFGGSAIAPSGYGVKLKQEARTGWDVLCELFGRRHGLGLFVAVTPGEGDSPDQVVLTSYSFASSTITLPDSSTLPPSTVTLALDYSQDPWLEKAELRQEAITQYDQVIVRGNRRGSVCTFSFSDANLVIDWDSTISTGYRTAASGDAGYGALDDAGKANANDAARRSEKWKRFARYFRLDQSWDGTTLNGAGDGDPQLAFPELDDSLNPISTGDGDPFWLSGLRFERHLPLLIDVDYSGDALGNGTATINAPTGALTEQMPMLAAISYPTENGANRAYALVDQLSSSTLSLQTNQPNTVPQFSCSIQLQDQAPGIIVTVHGPSQRAVQHVLAKGHFTPIDTADERQNYPVLDYAADNLLVTAYVLNDSFLEYRQPLDDDLPGGLKSKRQLMVAVRDAYLDYVPANTVVAVTNGQLVRPTAGGFVRDDRSRVMAIAQLAAAWYLPLRQCLTLTFSKIDLYAALGWLITSVAGGASGTETVNTVVTSVSYDFLSTRTTIQTSHAELDLKQF